MSSCHVRVSLEGCHSRYRTGGVSHHVHDWRGVTPVIGLEGCHSKYRTGGVSL